MPTVRARIRLGETVRRHPNKYGPGITPRYLTSGEVGDIEFDTSLFTESLAKEWLTNHDFATYTLSAGEDESPDEKHHRFLAIELAPSTNIQDIDGGLLVPGVKLLAPGTWTDSTQKTPCRYTPEVLQRYAANWTDLSYWSRHSGGTPRDITDRIADIRNVRYQDGIVADLFFHGATTKSQDSISLLKAAAAGKVPWPYSSVEMMTRDKWIVSEKLFEAQEVLFDGAAMVNQGACRVCKIRNNEWIQDESGESMTKKEQQAAAGSMEETQKVLQNAITEKFGKTGQGMEKYGAWIIATFPDRCVFRAPDDVVYEVVYTINEDGTVILGEPVEVEVTYQKKQQEIEMPDNKELEAQVEALKKELADLKAAQEPVKVEVPKELTDLIAAQEKTIKELSGRLEKIEKGPGDIKTKTATRELESTDTPEYFVPVNRKTGTVGSDA